MKRKITEFRLWALILLCAVLSVSAFSQKSVKETISSSGPAIIHEDVDIPQMDTFYGPGGREMVPDLSHIEFIRREHHGYNKKYRIRDGSGRVWVAKYGREARPETAATRLMWALGYPSEIDYWVPELTIPGVKTLKNVRLEARPDNIKRGDNWEWKRNPFVGSNELAGLKVMMVLLNNWDSSTIQNKIIQDKQTGRRYYIISDLGATFGKLGSSNIPLLWIIGRSIDKPQGYARTALVRDVKDGRIKLAYQGKHHSIYKDVSIPQARWLADRLVQLRDGQIRDAFRAAGYSNNDIDVLTAAVKKRINELDVASSTVERIATDRTTQKPYRRTRRH